MVLAPIVSVISASPQFGLRLGFAGGLGGLDLGFLENVQIAVG